MSYITGGFDLEGNTYDNKEDAIRAEMSQAEQIRRNHFERDLARNGQVYSEYIESLQGQINEMKEQITGLQETILILQGKSY